MKEIVFRGVIDAKIGVYPTTYWTNLPVLDEIKLLYDEHGSPKAVCQILPTTQLPIPPTDPDGYLSLRWRFRWYDEETARREDHVFHISQMKYKDEEFGFTRFTMYPSTTMEDGSPLPGEIATYLFMSEFCES